ncbi:juvenile hormone esterase-like [Sitodiplosis mosellana]|uniref:juvenile hormone esterase-like n=1 Tax=Sitodiplosis mosellana TaxID=263140 RepID=UPI002443C845|nr:juvenile hormone esterase-like [Sitodiplosis mosellana]
MNCVCWLIIFFVLFLSLYHLVGVESDRDDDQQFCTIKSKSGLIRGKFNRTLFDEKPYYSFRGIPFAKPPINERRFKAPEKIQPWNGTLDAFEFGNDCIQPDSEKQTFFGSEDCLYLNVFVPSDCSAINTTSKLPVMFYIFGGKFSFGTARFYGPDFLIETNVIVVTFNYRVGPHGFLSLGLPEYSGNMALKDQSLALKWISANIEHFGGDKNNIVLFGHSSGASSVNLHMISPQTNNLFQRAIMMSGSALNPFLPRHQDHSSILHHLAENLHYPVTNKRDLIKFLNQIDGKLLSKMTFQNDHVPGFGRKTFNRIWTVCIEDYNATEPFITQTPFDILTNHSYESNIDTLYSSSPKEFVLSHEQKQPELLKNFNNIFEIGFPLEMAQLDFDSEVYKNISRQIRYFYFNEKHVNAETLNGFNTLITDINFLYGIYLSARIQASKSNGRTFFSKFSVENEWNFSWRKAERSNFTADYAAHVDQLYYVFRFSAYPDIFPDEAYQTLKENSFPWQIIKNITNFYANFAKFKNPVPEKDPLQLISPESDQWHYFSVTNEGIHPRANPERHRITFWDNIFDQNKQQWNTTFNFHLA